MDHSCLGRTHAAVVFNVDIVDLLDPWVVAGGEEMLVFNVDIVDFLDPVVSHLDMYRTSVLMYRTMVLLARPTKGQMLDV